MVRKLKHTEIGDIPVDWELQTFDETFRVMSNNTLSRENLNNRGGAVRNIHYGDILTKFPEVLDCSEDEIPFVNDLSLLSSSTQLLQDGDIVVADTAEDETVGKVIEVQNLGDSKLVAGLHTIPCRVKKGDFAPGWLGYYMNSDLFHNQILPYITGIKVSSISKGAISETLILVPPFDEQEKIVQSLNKIQLLMTAETKVVNKIKLVKNGCLSKMFPQKDDTVPEIRLPGFTEPWEQRKLGDLADVTKLAGFEFTEHVVYSDEGNIIALRGLNIKNGQLILDDVKYIDGSNFSKLSRSKLFIDDIMFTYVGTVGEVAIIKENDRFYLAPNVSRIRVKSDDSPKFISHYMRTDNFKNKVIFPLIATSSQPALSMENIRKFMINMPKNRDEQDRLAEYFESLDHIITLHQRKCDKYSSIKKGMMSDLLTGKIRLV